MGLVTRAITLSAICCVLFCASWAHGASQTHVINISPTVTDWNQLVTIPKFNPVNGTLTMVTVTVSSHFQTKSDIENLAGNPNQITATETISVDLQPTPVVQWNLSPMVSMFTDSALLATNNGTSNFTGPDTLHVTSNNQQELQRAFTAAADLDQFTAMGGSLTWDINATATSSNSVVAENGAVQFQNENQASLKVKVKYTYVIPEPGSCLLLGMGSLLTLIRRRPR